MIGLFSWQTHEQNWYVCFVFCIVGNANVFWTTFCETQEVDWELWGTSVQYNIHERKCVQTREQPQILGCIYKQISLFEHGPHVFCQSTSWWNFHIAWGRVVSQNLVAKLVENNWLCTQDGKEQHIFLCEISCWTNLCWSSWLPNVQSKTWWGIWLSTFEKYSWKPQREDGFLSWIQLGVWAWSTFETQHDTSKSQNHGEWCVWLLYWLSVSSNIWQKLCDGKILWNSLKHGPLSISCSFQNYFGHQISCNISDTNCIQCHWQETNYKCFTPITATACMGSGSHTHQNTLCKVLLAAGEDSQASYFYFPEEWKFGGDFWWTWHFVSKTEWHCTFRGEEKLQVFDFLISM